MARKTRSDKGKKRKPRTVKKQYEVTYEYFDGSSMTFSSSPYWHDHPLYITSGGGRA